MVVDAVIPHRGQECTSRECHCQHKWNSHTWGGLVGNTSTLSLLEVCLCVCDSGAACFFWAVLASFHEVTVGTVVSGVALLLLRSQAAYRV